MDRLVGQVQEVTLFFQAPSVAFATAGRKGAVSPNQGTAVKGPVKGYFVVELVRVFLFQSELDCGVYECKG